MAFFPNYSETHVLFGGFTFVAQKKLGELFLEKKQPVIAERQTTSTPSTTSTTSSSAKNNFS